MIDRPTPDRRYEDDERQIAYEAGWRQEYDHDSLALLDRIETMVDDVHDEGERCRRRAAMLAGAAAALDELADRQLESVVLWETPDEEEKPC